MTAPPRMKRQLSRGPCDISRGPHLRSRRPSPPARRRTRMDMLNASQGETRRGRRARRGQSRPRFTGSRTLSWTSLGPVVGSGPAWWGQWTPSPCALCCSALRSPGQFSPRGRESPLSPLDVRGAGFCVCCKSKDLFLEEPARKRGNASGSRTHARAHAARVCSPGTGLRGARGAPSFPPLSARVPGWPPRPHHPRPPVRCGDK